MTHCENQPEMTFWPIKATSFFDLPPEIRDIIYSYAVVSEYPIRPDFEYYKIQGHSALVSAESPVIYWALLTVNRRISGEALAILNAKNAGIICDRYHKSIIDTNIDIGLSDNTHIGNRKRYEEHCLHHIKALQDGLHASMVSRLDTIHIWVDWIRGRLMSGSTPSSVIKIQLSELTVLLA
ncbi:hypothetical protein OEA41_007264 [Lepraria neglecta]|uniref:Uncharacterized protein n=1 Tax=Lepraria neglecta TaxID=209136 RepID=A0AAD9ZCH2_9LECA|nr:hypothetical protein OEA41_007264 [Lepraria neglecta]